MAQVVSPNTDVTYDEFSNTYTVPASISNKYRELKIDASPQYDRLYLLAEGADGGTGMYDNDFNEHYKGGGGATMEAVFEIGTGEGQIPQGSTIRMIVGRYGGSAPYAGGAGGGGGGTGIIYLPPGRDRNNQDEWVILLVAGGAVAVLRKKKNGHSALISCNTLGTGGAKHQGFGGGGVIADGIVNGESGHSESGKAGMPAGGSGGFGRN